MHRHRLANMLPSRSYDSRIRAMLDFPCVSPEASIGTPKNSAPRGVGVMVVALSRHEANRARSDWRFRCPNSAQILRHRDFRWAGGRALPIHHSGRNSLRFHCPLLDSEGRFHHVLRTDGEWPESVASPPGGEGH